MIESQTLQFLKNLGSPAVLEMTTVVEPVMILSVLVVLFVKAVDAGVPEAFGIPLIVIVSVVVAFVDPVVCMSSYNPRPTRW